MNTTDVTPPPPAPDFDLFAPTTKESTSCTPPSHSHQAEEHITESAQASREAACNVLSAERAWELKFVRTILPDGTAMNGLGEIEKRHFF